MTRGRRGGTPDQAREYRLQGHEAAERFAECVGGATYQRDQHAKKDVIDPAGDTHSVKSGQIKWQIFLYRRSRFASDYGFQALNGIGLLLIECIDAFPPARADYEQDKLAAKERLRIPMREIKNRLQNKNLFKAFLKKAIFNGEEVNYLTIYDDDIFHVYWNADVVEVMGDNFTVENSRSSRGNPDCQKVLFKYNDKNVGELEMRNDSEQHYREVRFNMLKKPCCELLQTHILDKYPYPDQPIVSYGEAISKFWKW